MLWRKQPGENLTRAVDFGMHRMVNDRLRELGRGGFGTVSRSIWTRALDNLIQHDEGFDAVALGEMLDLAVADAVYEYVNDLNRELGWLFHALSEANQTIDSLTLQRFIEERQNDMLEKEREFLATLLAPDTTEEVNEP